MEDKIKLVKEALLSQDLQVDIVDVAYSKYEYANKHDIKENNVNLGFIVMVLTGIGTQIINFTQDKHNGMTVVSIFVLLIFLGYSGKIFLKVKSDLSSVVDKIEKE